MINTTQTDLLDGVEPDARLDVEDQHTFGITRSLYGAEVRKLRVGDYQLYSRETVEALLIAHRKQVLLGLADYVDLYENRLDGDELRRMALGPTGVDKGEK
jgi:hypothetical protein